MENITAQVKFVPADKEFPVQIVFEDGTVQKLTSKLARGLCEGLVNAIEMDTGFRVANMLR